MFRIGNISPYVAILLLLLALWNLGKKANRYHQQAQALETTISDLNQEVRQTEIRLNDSISVYQAEVNALNVTQKNLKSMYNKLLSASKLQAKDVEAVTEISTVVHQIDTIVAMVDTFGGISASLRDPFVNIDVAVFPDKNTIIEYEVRDSLTLINVQKKHSWLFGLIKWTEHKETRAINHNPKAKITSLQTIDVIE